MTPDCMDDRTTTRISLKPCPFCGSPAELEEDSDHHGEWFNLGCSNHWGKRSDEKHCIGARIFYTAASKEKSGAIEKWNTRAQGAATPAPTAALTEDAPTTTDEGPKPKYGEFYAADLPEEQQYRKAVQVVIKEQKASTSFIQRHLQIGYNRAARLLERMVVEGICTEPNGVGKRTVLQPEVKPGQIDVMEF